MKKLLVLMLLLAAPLAARASDSDGAGARTGSSGTSFTSTWYAAHGASTTQTATQNFWVNAGARARCMGFVSVATAPGAGNSWTINLLHHATGATTNCAGDIGNLASESLCTISGSNKSCAFDSTFTLDAGSCLQIQAVAGGTPTGTTREEWSLRCVDSSGDGAAVVSPSFTTSFSANSTLGVAIGSSSHIIAPANYRKCDGAVRLVTAPGSGNWAVQLNYSTAALTGTQKCSDLSYSSVSALCGGALTGTTLACSFSAASINVPAGGCMAIILTAGSSPTATGGEQWALECSTSTGSPYNGGGPLYWAQPLAASVLAGTQYIGSSTGSSSGSTAENPFFSTDQALTTCSGSILVDGANSGLSFPFTLRYSTTPLDATGNCGGASYSEVTACTVTGGSSAGVCTFADVAMPAAAKSCFGFHTTGASAAGTPTPAGNAYFSMNCVLPPSTPTPTPTVCGAPNGRGCCDHTAVTPGTDATPQPCVTPGYDCTCPSGTTRRANGICQCWDGAAFSTCP